MRRPLQLTLLLEVIDLSYDALGGVVEILTGSWLDARKIERLRRRASDDVDGTLGKGRWEQHAFDGNFERYVEQEADTFKGSIARHMMWQIATGRAKGINARAQAMDGQLDARLDTRARTIDTRAAALCGHVQTLRRLQDALAVRYQGQPLRLLMWPLTAIAVAILQRHASRRRASNGMPQPKTLFSYPTRCNRQLTSITHRQFLSSIASSSVQGVGTKSG
ncbi:DUF2884 family protein [Xanthomonas oryzae pv. oryzicola]|uniref:Uncharacterized protein n=1 Tax=Xanthomonas oryzae pv. oryzicola (strain BLS256) TaxID=383407 RepID=G7TLY8_XANOB|nr:DUF2884 family protein [Xanthomonas oryzae]AEQ97139.1 hypothetical protein XOC_3041 [Xanthomonas oryzae pv. oryzicola BLS256]PUE97020.1 DUF2884 domain-containing protein [Xanthomonas oryzae pv. oryzicola]QEO96749.1 hypothetical protein XOCgx_1757 [Xanthomonas oryzae pv. oryzicola]QGH65672.1 DUF2884 family protein [Xanthomonas oryzae pv. oryzicola]UBB94301.1 YggN family protein [Xanthomonas oryzae pv. oryzicola]